MTFLKKLAILCQILLFQSFIFGQTSAEEIAKDKNISWAGEVYMDYSTSLGYQDKEALKAIGIEDRNIFRTLKLMVTKLDGSVDEDHLLVNKVLRALGNGGEAYADDELKNKLTREEISALGARTDTIYAFDPETMEDRLQILTNDLNLDDIKCFRLKQHIYYNSKDAMFRTVPVSIALIIDHYDGKKLLKTGPMCWMPIEILTTAPDLNDTNIDWAKRSYRNFDFKKIKTTKGENITKALDELMASIRSSKGTISLGSINSADGNYVMSKKEVISLTSLTDTIITFDANTFEEIVTVVANDPKSKHIKSIRFIQDWVWNKKENKLSIRFIGFSPIIDRFGNDGKFLNRGPMFHRNEDYIKK